MRLLSCPEREGRTPWEDSCSWAKSHHRPMSRPPSHGRLARLSLSSSFSASITFLLPLAFLYLCLQDSGAAAELRGPRNDPPIHWWHQITQLAHHGSGQSIHSGGTESAHFARILLNASTEHTAGPQAQPVAGAQATGGAKAGASTTASAGSGHAGETGGLAKAAPRQQQPQPQQGGGGGGGASGLLYVRWCCVGPAEMEFCQATVPALTSRQESQHWSCVVKESKEACMDAVGAGEAELVGLDAGLAYRAFAGKRMKAVAAERMDYGERYDAVAIVHKSLCLQAPRGRGAAEGTPRGGREESEGAIGGLEGVRNTEGAAGGNATAAPGAGAGGGGVPKATAGTGTAAGVPGDAGHAQVESAGPGRGPGLWKLLPKLRSCHPFYGSSAGWDLPTLLLLSLRFPMPWDAPRGGAPGETPGVPPQLQGLAPDAQVMASVFAKSCAPSTSLGAAAGAPGGAQGAPGGRQGGGGGGGGSGRGPLQEQRLCSGCRGEGGAAPECDLGDPYAGYSGAYRCLVEGAGDIAFTRASVAPLFSKGGHYAQAWSTLPASEFRYLCPPPVGGCLDIVDDPAAFNCTIGRIPSNVIMTRNAIPEMDKLRIVARLETAGMVPRWRAALYEGGNNPHDHLLTSGARGLVRVDELTRAYLGEAGAAAARVQSFNFKEEAVEGLGNAASEARYPRMLLLCALILSSMLVLDWRVRGHCA